MGSLDALASPKKRRQTAGITHRLYAAFAVENLDGAAIEIVGAGVGIGHAHDPDLAEFREGADQVKDDAFL